MILAEKEHNDLIGVFVDDVYRGMFGEEFAVEDVDGLP